MKNFRALEKAGLKIKIEDTTDEENEDGEVKTPKEKVMTPEKKEDESGKQATPPKDGEVKEEEVKAEEKPAGDGEGSDISVEVDFAALGAGIGSHDKAEIMTKLETMQKEIDDIREGNVALKSYHAPEDEADADQGENEDGDGPKEKDLGEIGEEGSRIVDTPAEEVDLENAVIAASRVEFDELREAHDFDIAELKKEIESLHSKQRKFGDFKTELQNKVLKKIERQQKKVEDWIKVEDDKRAKVEQDFIDSIMESTSDRGTEAGGGQNSSRFLIHKTSSKKLMPKLSHLDHKSKNGPKLNI